MKKYLSLLTVSIIAIAIVLGLGELRIVDDLESTSLDLRELAFAPETSVSNRIVMVWLDESTMSELPYRSPVPRDFLKKLNDQLMRAGPAAIGYDVYLKDPSFPKLDRALADSLSRTNAYAVMPMRPPDKPGIEGIVDPPMKMFKKSLEGLGLADLPIGAFDTKVRGARLSYATDEGKTPTFASLLFNAATGSDSLEAVSAKWHWPSLGIFKFTPFFKGDDVILIRFVGPPSKRGEGINKFKVAPAKLVADGVLPLKWFQDKIILVGAAYSDMMDAYPTPYYGRATGFARMNGVEIHANVLNQFMTGQFYYGLKSWHKWLLVVVLVFMAATLALFVSPVRAAVAIIGMIVIVPTFSVFAFRGGGVVVPIVVPLMAIASAFGVGVIVRALSEGRQKRFIKQVFSRYVPATVVDRIAKNPKLAQLGGEERLVTSMFTDIASFTSISENMQPTELVSFLNAYLERMNHVVLGHGGTIDKYEGDAVIAFFNAPLDVENHRAKALMAAIEIQEATKKVTDEWRERLGRDLQTRVGVHTGRAVVGNLGSEGRFDYTAIGDTINLASRLEGANKYYGTNVLASEEAVKDASSEIVTRPVDRIRVKGREKPVVIYEVMGLADRIDQEIKEGLLKPYLKAYELLGSRSCGDAKKMFREILKVHPEDIPTKKAAERCQRAIENPHWDLVTELVSK
jgi:adenylate cyclase